MSPGSNSAKVQWSVMAREMLDRRILALLSRGIDRWEIVQSLSQPTRPGAPGMGFEKNPYYTLNPKTNHPYSPSTIYAHAQAILDEWKRRDSEKFDQVFAGIIGSTEEARRAAWAAGDLEMVLSCNAMLAKLTGAWAPTKIEVRTPQDFDPRRLTNDQLDAAIDGMPYEQVLLLGDGEDDSNTVDNGLRQDQV